MFFLYKKYYVINIKLYIYICAIVGYLGVVNSTNKNKYISYNAYISLNVFLYKKYYVINIKLYIYIS